MRVVPAMMATILLGGLLAGCGHRMTGPAATGANSTAPEAAATATAGKPGDGKQTGASP